MLKNRGVAWGLTILAAVLSVFFGANISFARMRAVPAAAFEVQIIPIVHQAMVPAFNMQTVAQGYLNASEINSIGISSIVENIQNSNEPKLVEQNFINLNRAVWALYDRLEKIELSEQNRGFIRAFHADFIELDLILSQAAYNTLAAEFNEALGKNLGFLAEPFIGRMPRFD